MKYSKTFFKSLVIILIILDLFTHNELTRIRTEILLATCLIVYTLISMEQRLKK